MKNTIKISILLLAIILAIGGVLVYAHTKVAPPQSPAYTNQYNLDLLQSYKKLSNAEDELQSDSIFSTASDRIKIFDNENKFDDKESFYDNLYELIDIYVPQFLKYSFSKFQRSDWSNNNHDKMVHRANELLALRYSDDTDILSYTNIKSLEEIKSTVADYNQAIIVSTVRTYRGINNARSNINQANSYASHEYLKNCTSLRNELNEVRGRIAQSHYNYVSNEIKRLNNYKYFSKEYFDETLIPEVADVILVYEDNASSLYGSNSKANELWSNARRLQIKANDYYSTSNSIK